MTDFDDNPEERLLGTAEELMRQGRFQDAVQRYQDVCAQNASDMWAHLAYVSALECAGQVTQAEQLMSDLARTHSRNVSLHRFQHLFFKRREDFMRANLCQEMLQNYEGFDSAFNDAPVDMLADLYFNQGRYHEALKELERIFHEETLSDDGLRASIIGRMGACHRQEDNLGQARTLLNEALDYHSSVESDTEHNWILTELAEIERSDGHYKEAFDLYQQAIDHQPDDYITRSRLAQLHYENGNEPEALALYDAILSEKPQSHWAMLELAQILSTSDPVRSHALCQEVLDHDATIPTVYAQLGQLARNAGNLEEARKNFLEAQSVNPHANWILHELADISCRLGRTEEAETLLTQARHNDPFDAVTYGVHADILRNSNKLSDAVPFLKKAVELDASYTWAWRELAEINALLGNAADAADAHASYGELESNLAYTDGLHAFLLGQDNKQRAAIPYLERAVRLQPDYQWAWRELIDHHLQQEDFKQAESSVRQALVHFPETATFWGMLTEALRHQNKYTEAHDSIKKGIHYNDSIPQLWALRAEIALEGDMYADAVHAAQRAWDLQPRSEHAVLYAQALLLAKRLDEAFAIIRQRIDGGDTAAPLFDMASEISLRQQKVDTALAFCEQGLLHHEKNKRLLMRRAQLALHDDEQDFSYAHDILRLAFALPQPTAWQDFILPFATVGDINAARQAAYHYISDCASADDQTQHARAWLILAEAELTCKHIPEARHALQESLRLDPESVPARLLLGMLAEQSKDFDEAERQLSHVYKHICENEETGTSSDANSDTETGTTPSSPTDTFLLLRQLSHIEEQRGNSDAARQYLTERCQRHDRLSAIIDRAAFDLRHAQNDDTDTPASTYAEQAENTLQTRLTQLCARIDASGENSSDDNSKDETSDQPTTSEAHTFIQSILHHLSWHHLQRHDNEYAYTWIDGYRAYMDNSCHHLAAQLALGYGNYSHAEAHITAIADDERSDAQQLLLCRAHIGQGNYRTATIYAQHILRENPDNEEAAILYSEATAFDDDYPQALKILMDAKLNAAKPRPNDERLFLCACLLLEVHGSQHCLSYLGRTRPAHVENTPIKRLLQAAFGSAWADSNDPTHDSSTHTIIPATVEDIHALPPFSHTLRNLGLSLYAASTDTDHPDSQHNAYELAHHVLIHAHELSTYSETHGARDTTLDRALVHSLLAQGQRKSAWGYAWKAKSLALLLHCCVPYKMRTMSMTPHTDL